jgi:hypothetical protein
MFLFSHAMKIKYITALAAMLRNGHTYMRSADFSIHDWYDWWCGAP